MNNNLLTISDQESTQKFKFKKQNYLQFILKETKTEADHITHLCKYCRLHFKLDICSF